MNNIGLTEWECREIAEEKNMANDPTYDRAEIDKNPEWRIAFILSEFYNDNAPLGWSRYLPAAKAIHEDYKKFKEAGDGVATEDSDS